MQFDHYNLLISGLPGKWDAGSALISADRYLEHTVAQVSARFAPLDDAVIKRLVSMPALFAYEKDRSDPREARAGRITDIQHRATGYFITFEFDEQMSPLSQSLLEDLQEDLDIDVRGGELSRTHWAVKQVDLYATLRRRGLAAQSAPYSSSSTARAPAPISPFGGKLDGLTQAVEALGPALDQRFKSREVLIPDAAAARPENLSAPIALVPTPKAKVFIVHGRADGVKQEVARFLERIGVEPVILHERPNGGRTLITKFQEESADVAYAVVLMTPDDVGGLGDGLMNNLQPRARQNVIFELGFFIGKLGAGRVCALVQGHVEKPSDFDAVVYVQYDGTEPWQLLLARELAHARIPHDVSRLVAR